MFHTSLRWLVPALGLAAVVTAQAQTAPPPAGPDPLDPQVSVPGLVFESSFARYRRVAEGAPVSWREANDTVARIGGWRVYLREAQQPLASPAKPVP